MNDIQFRDEIVNQVKNVGSSIQDNINEQLVMASFFGQHSKINELIAKGANVDYVVVRDIGYFIKPGYSSLICAAIGGHEKGVEALIKHGAEVNFQALNVNQTTALHQAATLEKSECIKSLVEAGANVNALDRFGYTPLMCSIKYATHNNNEINRYLIEKGTDLAVINIDGKTASDIAKHENSFNAFHMIESMKDKILKVIHDHLPPSLDISRLASKSAVAVDGVKQDDDSGLIVS